MLNYPEFLVTDPETGKQKWETMRGKGRKDAEKGNVPVRWVKSPSAVGLGAGFSHAPLIEKTRIAYLSGPTEITEYRFLGMGNVRIRKYDTITRKVKLQEVEETEAFVGLCDIAGIPAKTKMVEEITVSVFAAFDIFSRDVWSGTARLYVSDVNTRWRGNFRVTTEKTEDPDKPEKKSLVVLTEEETKTIKKANRKIREENARRKEEGEGEEQQTEDVGQIAESLDDVSKLSRIFMRWAGKKDLDFRSVLSPAVQAIGVKSHFPTLERVVFGALKGKCRPKNSNGQSRLPTTKAGGAVLPKGKELIERLESTLKRQTQYMEESLEREDFVDADHWAEMAAETEIWINRERYNLIQKEEKQEKQELARETAKTA